MKTKIIILFACVCFLSACTTGTLQNGATIVPDENGEDVIQLPPAPTGCVIKKIDCNGDLLISYQDTINSKELTVMYYDNDNFFSFDASNFTIILP